MLDELTDARKELDGGDFLVAGPTQGLVDPGAAGDLVGREVLNRESKALGRFGLQYETIPK
eukprot:1958814-Pyramimonas_sp.AAC.1